MKLIPSSNLIGGEIKDIDLSKPLSEEVFGRFQEYFYERSVLTIRNQSLSAEAFLRFSRNFGEPDQHFLTHYAHPEYSNILVLSNIRKDGLLRGFADAGRVWHSDGSYMQNPVGVTMLYAIEVPVQDGSALGNTLFASAWAAYNELSDKTKAQIETLQAVHQVGGRRKKIGTGEKSDRMQEDAQPEAFHPVVRVHPYTGRKYIFVSKGECQKIVGMENKIALELIDELADAVKKSRYRYVHSWQVGDVLVWDNQAVQHLANHDYEWPKHRRLIYRVTVPEENILINR